METINNLIDLFHHFSDEKTCVEFLEVQRWNGTPICPHCGSEHHYRVKTRLRHPQLEGYKDFQCKACIKKYSVLTGTVYESSKVPLRKWFVAAYLMQSGKKGISSLQLARHISVTPKTAWFMLHRLRTMLVEKAPEIIEGCVELDETFVGGKNKNRHQDKKVAYRKTSGRSFIDKTPVLGMLNRSGKVRCFVVRDTSRNSLQPLIFQNIRRGSTLYTDEWIAYAGLRENYVHQVVRHNRGEYANGDVSTNAIENFWSCCKRSIMGVFHYVSRKHMQRYFDEFAYRFNTRLMTDVERFYNMMGLCNETRLLYKVLTS